MQDYKERLLAEIASTAGPKLFNIKEGTATEREREIVSECSAYLCLLNYSVLKPKEIYKLWENSNLVYM